jgi:hypothetical protein
MDSVAEAGAATAREGGWSKVEQQLTNAMPDWYKKLTRVNDGKKMPLHPIAAHCAHEILGVGRGGHEPRADLGCASSELRGHAALVNGG